MDSLLGQWPMLLAAPKLWRLYYIISALRGIMPPWKPSARPPSWDIPSGLVPASMPPTSWFCFKKLLEESQNHPIENEWKGWNKMGSGATIWPLGGMSGRSIGAPKGIVPFSSCAVGDEFVCWKDWQWGRGQTKCCRGIVVNHTMELTCPCGMDFIGQFHILTMSHWYFASLLEMMLALMQDNYDLDARPPLNWIEAESNSHSFHYHPHPTSPQHCTLHPKSQNSPLSKSDTFLTSLLALLSQWNKPPSPFPEIPLSMALFHWGISPSSRMLGLMLCFREWQICQAWRRNCSGMVVISIWGGLSLMTTMIGCINNRPCSCHSPWILLLPD